MVDIQDIGGITGDIILAASFDGRLKSNEGFLSSVGDLAILTANTGKDMYLIRAKICFFANTNPAGDDGIGDKVELKLNGAAIETGVITWTVDSGNGNAYAVLDYDFKNTGGKVAASQIIKLEVISIDTEMDVEGFVQAIEVPTGEDPTTYRGD